jgi:hypothetical protein
MWSNAEAMLFSSQKLRGKQEPVSIFFMKASSEILSFFQAEAHLHVVSDSQQTHLHDVSDSQQTHLHDVSDSQQKHLHDVSDSQQTHLHDVSDSQQTHLHDVSDSQQRHLHDVSDSQQMHPIPISTKLLPKFTTLWNGLFLMKNVSKNRGSVY